MLLYTSFFSFQRLSCPRWSDISPTHWCGSPWKTTWRIVLQPPITLIVPSSQSPFKKISTSRRNWRGGGLPSCPYFLFCLKGLCREGATWWGGGLDCPLPIQKLISAAPPMVGWRELTANSAWKASWVCTSLSVTHNSVQATPYASCVG